MNKCSNNNFYSTHTPGGGVDSNLCVYLPAPVCELVVTSGFQKHGKKENENIFKVQLIFGICMCSYICEGVRVQA